MKNFQVKYVCRVQKVRPSSVQQVLKVLQVSLELQGLGDLDHEAPPVHLDPQDKFMLTAQVCVRERLINELAGIILEADFNR